MTLNRPERPNSQIVYTSVDDEMSVTEIICEYGDNDEIDPKSVCEVEASDVTQTHIYIEDSLSNGNSRTPIVREGKLFVDSEEALNPSLSVKQEQIYIEDTDGTSFHEIFADDKKFKCGVCCEQFDDLQTISRHMEMHSGEKKYECAECGKQFKNINNVMRHMVVHSGERKFMCPVCHKPFTQVGNLKRHMLTHSGEKKFPCSVCGKAFTQMNNLIRHQAIHSGQKNFECQLCRRLFNQISNLNRHMLIHKGIKMYKCKTCGRAFSQLTNLQKHNERHTRGKKYLCKECGEGFDHKLFFNRHMESHFGKPRYQCKVCGRVVTQKSTLNQHMLLHFEEKRYACQKCTKTYAQKGSLAKHMEAHNNVRHHCKICNRYFYVEKGLLKHEASHTDKAKTIASFVKKETRPPDCDLQFCEICGKSFILKRSLRRHMAKEHDTIIENRRKMPCHGYICELCDKIFVHRKSLKKHSVRQHGVSIENKAEIKRLILTGEKENEDTESAKENEDRLQDDQVITEDITKADIADVLLKIKQEHEIKEETLLEGEIDDEWHDLAYFKHKEEHKSQEKMDASVHLCKLCGKGYYLVNNLRKHMAIKHGLAIEEENEGRALKDTNSEPNIKLSSPVVSLVVKDKKATAEEGDYTLLDGDEDSEKELAILANSKVKKRRGRKRQVMLDVANQCKTCREDFQSSVDLLLHMLHHSKEKKNDLLNVVNEAAQEFQSIKKSEADLSVTEMTKGLVSHFRKCSRNQSAEISSVFSISEKYQENSSPERDSEAFENSCKGSFGVESIILEEGIEETQRVIEINADRNDCEDMEDENSEDIVQKLVL